MRLSFLGAAQTVTGSRFLVEDGETRVLVDCGLFQGFKHLRLKNREPFGFSPESLKSVILTHAHLDHSGALPLLVDQGFKGKIFSTRPTQELSEVLLLDAGYLQEEEAKYANRHHYSKHNPALPLYTVAQARAALPFFSPVDYRRIYKISSEVTFELFQAGHLLGAASVLLTVKGKRILFSGDLGRPHDPLMLPPEFAGEADFVVVESTYGGRVHDQQDMFTAVEEAVKLSLQQKGVLLIPSFAVGRAQLLLFVVSELKRQGRIPKELPVFLNSPMAAKANEIFCRHSEEHRLDAPTAERICREAHIVASVEESVALNERKGPMILIAASGMATGGRVLHHLKAFGPDPRHVILFAGYQAGGTRGEALVKGASEVKIHGQYWPIRAKILSMDCMSAHADSLEVMEWLRGLKGRPQKVFVVHGESGAADHFRMSIQDKLGWDAYVPQNGEQVELK